MAKIADMSEKQIVALIDKTIVRFKGQSNNLEGAIGALMLGRRVGWKPLLLMHDRRRINKYEEILGVKFRDILDEEGDKALKSFAWSAVKKLSNFWKAASGNTAKVRSNVMV